MSPLPLVAGLVVLGLGAGCSTPVVPVDLTGEVVLETSDPSRLDASVPGAWVQSAPIVGHLSGVGVPLGSRVKEATYSTVKSEVVLADVLCGPRVDAAYQAAGVAVGRACTGGELTLTGTGEAVQPWNPWGQDHWHVGPLTVLPKVDPGASYKPAELHFDGTRAEARLSPKDPNTFVDVLSAGMADSDWAARPIPGGTQYTRGGWKARVDQDGAIVTIHLEGPPVAPRP